MDFEKHEFILRVKDKQSFIMNTLLKQPTYLDECKWIVGFFDTH